MDLKQLLEFAGVGHTAQAKKMLEAMQQNTKVDIWGDVYIISAPWPQIFNQLSDEARQLIQLWDQQGDPIEVTQTQEQSSTTIDEFKVTMDTAVASAQMDGWDPA